MISHETTNPGKELNKNNKPINLLEVNIGEYLYNCRIEENLVNKT